MHPEPLACAGMTATTEGGDCSRPVTHIDRKGYAYCVKCGLERRSYQPCRKLRGWELRRLQSGKQLARY